MGLEVSNVVWNVGVKVPSREETRKLPRKWAQCPCQGSQSPKFRDLHFCAWFGAQNVHVVAAIAAADTSADGASSS